MDSRHRLEAFLDKAIHSDIQFSFCIPRSSSSLPSSHGASTFERHSFHRPSSSSRTLDNMLHAHSCILKTAGTPPMQRLVSALDSDGHNNEATGSPEGFIREIRFEDSPPAAVEAVIRYIYLGQRPVLEPHCGYTVKDLMALASYLQIECLQDHCVNLVLGRKPDQDTASKRRSVPGASPSNHTRRLGGGFHPYRPQAWQSHERAQHGLYSRARGTSSTTGADRMLRSRISPESAIQVLFGWGYKFPRMRRELIRAFVHDQGHRRVDMEAEEMTVLQRYRHHEAFDAILEEMVAEGFGWELERRV